MAVEPLGMGKVYAPEAALPVIEHAFNTVGVDQIVADIDPCNQSSIRVSEKLELKFVEDGIHGNIPCKRYAMNRNEFGEKYP